MKLTEQIAKLFRDVHYGDNWTGVNLKDTLADVDWTIAVKKIEQYNSIGALIFHINYYVNAVASVLEGNPLNAGDKYSFDCPSISSQQDWDRLLGKTWADAERFAKLVEELPDAKLSETFVLEKYGNYYRNLHGVIEHCHYHLGQIVLLKKMIALISSS